MRRGAIILTGATGVVGMEVLARLVERGEDDIVVIVRAADARDARERLERTLARLWDVPGGMGGGGGRPGGMRVRAMRGDVTMPGLGLAPRDRRQLVAGADRIVHCAAAVGFDQPLAEALEINVLGTQQVLELAADLRGLRRMVHVSTAFVSGRHDGRFAETDLAVGQRFRNTYEQSKQLAERLVASSGLPVAVARPSIVVGDAQTGWTPGFSGLYLPLRAFARGLLDRIPADPAGIVDVVSLDYVAGALLAILDAPGADGVTFNLVAGDGAATVADVLRLGEQYLGQPRPVIAPLRRGGGTEPLVPYFDVRTTFDDRAARALLAPLGLSAAPLDVLFDRIMDYAEATRWGRAPTTRQAAGERVAALHVLA